MLISGECSDSPLPPHPFTSTRTLFIHQLTAQIFAYATSILYFIPLKKKSLNFWYVWFCKQNRVFFMTALLCKSYVSPLDIVDTHCFWNEFLSEWMVHISEWMNDTHFSAETTEKYYPRIRIIVRCSLMLWRKAMSLNFV